MEFSTLNGYKVKDKKAIRYYDTVDDMKSDTTLKNGMYAKTKGYYSANDGGHGEYIIKSSSNELYEELDNNLVAELIIQDVININSLGADNTGINDSSTIIQNAFNYIENKWLNGIYNLNTVVFNGIYLINNTLEMTPFIKITNNGFVTFKTNTSPVIWIHYVNGTIPESFIGEKLQYQYANLIDFPKGCLFENIDGEKQNTCIEIGEHSDTLAKSISRFKLCNFSIENYNIGLQYNNFNVYICNHERLQIEGNNIGVKLGDHSTAKVNSGEHMVFNNCLLAHLQYAFLYETTGFDLEITNSSIDFNTYVVSDPYAKGYHKIAISTTHIEGNTHIFGTIGYPSMCNLLNNRFILYLDAENENQFMIANDSESGSDVSKINQNTCNIENSYFIYARIGTTIDPQYITYKSYMIMNLINNYYQDTISRLEVMDGNIIKSAIDGLTDGTITVSTNTVLNNQLKIVGNSGFKTSATVVTDNYLYTGHKSIVLYKSSDSADNINFNIETSLLPVKKRIYRANWFTYNKKTGGLIRFYFYDKDGNEISQTDSYHYNPTPTTTNNQWYMSDSCKIGIAPLNAAYFKVVFYFANWNNSTAEAEDTEYKLGGLIIN